MSEEITVNVQEETPNITVNVQEETLQVNVNIQEAENGKGLPSGGTIRQIPVKQSSNNYDIGWVGGDPLDISAFTYVLRDSNGDIFATNQRFTNKLCYDFEGYTAQFGGINLTSDRTWTFPDADVEITGPFVVNGDVEINGAFTTLTDFYTGGIINISNGFVTTGGNLTFSLTGNTNLILPTSGTLVNTATLNSGLAGKQDIIATLDVSKGGTGQTSFSNGQLLIGNTTGNTLTKATLTGTANQVIVTNGGGSITLSTPQDLATTSSPTFGNLKSTFGLALGGSITTPSANNIEGNGYINLNVSGANSFGVSASECVSYKLLRPGGSTNTLDLGTTSNKFRSIYIGTSITNDGSLTVTGTSSLGSGMSLTGSQATNVLDLSPTWNTTGNPSLIYGRVTNTASGASSNLIDLGTVAGGSLFKVDKNANLTLSSLTPQLNFSVGGNIRQLFYSDGSNLRLRFQTGNFLQFQGASGAAASAHGLDWISNNVSFLSENSATLAQRNGTNPQSYRIYNTYTDSANYERANIGWSENSFSISTSGLGSGANNRAIYMSSGGVLGLSSGNGWDVNISPGGTESYAIDFKSTGISFRTDNSIDIGASGANRPRDIYVGRNITISGDIIATSVGATTPGTGAFTSINASGILNVTNSTQSFTTADGAIKTAGGLGVVKSANIGGNLSVAGSITTAGSTVAKTSEVFDFTRTTAPAGATGGTGLWTWTIPTGAKTAQILVIGGGCGGGSGARRAVNVNACGGGGGTASWNMALIPVTAGTTATVTVGAGGAGGAAVTTDDTNGNNGSQGEISKISFAAANSGSVETWNMTFTTVAQGGTTSASAAGGTALNAGIYTQSAGGGGGSATGSGSSVGQCIGPASGGGGGGVSGATNTATTKGFGGSGFYMKTAMLAGFTTTGNGGNGGDGNASGAGQAGSVGVFPGGGGGGGGGCRNGFSSGAGGAGADGLVRIIVFY